VSECIDKQGSCEDWAANGLCESQPAFMLPNCPKACKECGPQQTTRSKRQTLQPNDATTFAPTVEPTEVVTEVPEEGGFQCYSCSLDFRLVGYERDNPCLGRHVNLSQEYIVTCGRKDLFCMAQRTEWNGILIDLSRSCTDECYYGCRPKGYGVAIDHCVECCYSNSTACNTMYPSSSAVVITFSVPSLLLCGLFSISYYSLKL
ncbi:unnamed protein product, partial [Meganyctiphanes norvegica]